MPDTIRTSESPLVPFIPQPPAIARASSLPTLGQVVNIAPSPTLALPSPHPASFNRETQPVPSLMPPLRPLNVTNRTQPEMSAVSVAATSFTAPELLPAQRSCSFPGATKAGMRQQHPGDVVAAAKSRPGELNISSPRVLRYTQTMLSDTPALTERIFHETTQLHKKALQSFIGKSQYSLSDYARIKQALKHLLVTANPDRLKAIAHRVSRDHTLSAVDKNKLLEHIQLTEQWSKPLVQKDARASRVDLSALAASLNDDLIAMMVKRGITGAQLHAFVRASSLAENMINLDLLLIAGDHVDIQLQYFAEEHTLSGGIRYEAERIIDEFEHEMYSINDYIDKRVGLRIEDDRDTFSHTLLNNYPEENFDCVAELDSFDNHPVAGVSKAEVVKNRLIRILEINFLRSHPLLALFKQISVYSPILMERSVLNQEQLNLLNHRHDVRKISKMIKPPYGERARRLLRKMAVAPFIFGDTTQPPALNLNGVPYGYRGLPFTTFDGWISDTKISAQRLEYIGLYSNERLAEITQTGKLDLAWMAPLSDATLERFFAERYDLPHPELEHHTLAFPRALNEIGKAIVRPDYDYRHLPELLAWVRKHLSWPASDNDLASLLFKETRANKKLAQALYNAPARVELSVMTIAAKIILAEKTPLVAQQINNFSYPKRKVIEEFQQLIQKDITPETLNEIQLPDKVRQQVNHLLSQETLLSFIAQRLDIRIIQEDEMDEFRRFYATSGVMYSTPPREQTAALILRPGSLTPIEADGRQRETIELEYGDNYSLLREVLSYVRYREGYRPDPVEFNKALVALGQELIEQ